MTLATLVLSNLNDPQALAKLRLERYRVRRYLSLGNQLGAKIALCDVVFYAALAYHNRLLSYTDALEKIAVSAYPVGLSLLDAFQLAEIKYELRVQAEKVIDPQAEREAIASYRGE